MRLQFYALTIAATFLFSVNALQAQFVGVGEATPNSKVDVVHTGTTGNSLEINHNGTTNGSSASWIRNSGVGRALNAQMLNNANNIPAIQIGQAGTGVNARGLEIDMTGTTASALGLGIWLDGTGMGHYVQISNAANGNPGIRVQNGGAGWSSMNVATGSGSGQLNWVTGTGFFGTVDDMELAGGGIANLAWFNGTGPGSGFVMDSLNGDGMGHSASVTTATPTTGNTVYGAPFAGEQYGVGHGILINHRGTAGRNAEFNTENGANTSPTIFATHQGPASVIVAQNQDNVILGTISVADISYTGTDIADHIGVEGTSTPAAGWGVGVQGTGNWQGVHGVGGTYAVYATGNLAATGTKTFLIDHPADPENKYLRHFSIESDEIMNMYRGVVTLNGSGEAIVKLPDYFELINIDPSYQLTPIGTSQQPWIAQEISNNQFKVAGAPNSKVSWLVMAQRNDPYVQQHPDMITDVYEKEEGRKGKYLMPELFGQPKEKWMNYREKVQHNAPALGGFDKSYRKQYEEFKQRATGQTERGAEGQQPYLKQEKETQPAGK